MRNMQLVVWTLLIIIALSGTASAQGEGGLIIYGKDFAFGVTQPVNWQGNIADAHRYEMNAYFYLQGYTITDSPAIMYIQVMSKRGHSLEEHLRADMESFTAKRTVSFTDYEIDSLEYKSVSKKYLIKEKNVDYICFLDPGDENPLYIIFVLHAPKEICDDYLPHFEKLVKSFFWIGDKVIINK